MDNSRLLAGYTVHVARMKLRVADYSVLARADDTLWATGLEYISRGCLVLTQGAE